MDWHYADNGQQVGPVSEEQLLALVQSGVVKPDSLVWRPGMAEWKPFRTAGPEAPPPMPPPAPFSAPGGAASSPAPARFCSSCGRSFPAADLAMFGESAICVECKPAWIQRLRQGMESTTPAPFRYAGFWIRTGAVLIDSLILGIVQSVIFMILFGGTFASMFTVAARGGDPSETAALLAPMFGFIGLYQLLSYALQCAYSSFLWVKYGATLGQMAVGIKVVRPDGSPLSWGVAIGRYFAFLLSTLILCIGHMMAGWDDEKRALHDRLAGTRVIHAR
jgi:uncharacterized RDD family membrane protein YckC